MLNKYDINVKHVEVIQKLQTYGTLNQMLSRSLCLTRTIDLTFVAV